MTIFSSCLDRDFDKGSWLDGGNYREKSFPFRLIFFCNFLLFLWFFGERYRKIWLLLTKKFSFQFVDVDEDIASGVLYEKNQIFHPTTLKSILKSIKNIHQKIQTNPFHQKGPLHLFFCQINIKFFSMCKRNFGDINTKKKNWIFLSAVYSSLHPLIPHVAYGGRYWLNLPLKREREKNSHLFFQFHFSTISMCC